MIIHSLLVLLGLVNASLGQPTELEPEAKYAGYKVLAITPTSEDQVALLADYMTSTTFYNCSMDWWNEPRRPAVPVSLGKIWK